MLGFVTLIKLILSFGSGSNQTELKNYFKFVDSTPNKSALTLQRAKLNANAFSILFYNCTSRLLSIIDLKRFKGYRIAATDGSDILLPKDSTNPHTFCHKKGEDGYNKKHLNTLFDPLNHLNLAFDFNTVDKSSERDSLLGMLSAIIGKKIILLADRGYEGYNLIAHCIESNIKFAIRAKDLASNGILAGISYLLPDQEEFDTTITLHLTRRKEKDKKSNPHVKVLTSATIFDFLTKDVFYYTITFRVVAFKLSSGITECLITNLSPEEFTTADLKELYNIRSMAST